MKRGKYQTSPKGVSSKAVALVLALVLTIGCVVGGTIAWLTDDTDPVVNTFTVGDINIDLTETFNTDTNQDKVADAWFGKMVPGNVLSKDPEVTVKANSEACWLFVKIEESENFDTYMTYAIADGWNALTDVAGVYYREVDATTTDTDFAVLKGNEVTVLNTVTKIQLEEAKTSKPTLTFTAYAVQKDNVADATAAWAIANSTT